MERLRVSGEYGRSVLFAVAAAALFAFSMPLSKILLHSLPPVLLAGLLYLGAGVGAVIVLLVSSGTPAGAPPARVFSRRDLPYVLGMVLLRYSGSCAAPLRVERGFRVRRRAAEQL